MYELKVKVIKRDGSEEELIPEKITVSLLKAGASVDVARKITLIVLSKILEKNVDKITTKELMKEALSLLKKENEEWYNNWIVFDRAVKRRASEKEIVS